jgi:hypothetical protein
VAVVLTVLGFLAYMFVIPAEWIRVVITVLATGAGYWATISSWHPSSRSWPVQRTRASNASRSKISIGSSR